MLHTHCDLWCGERDVKVKCFINSHLSLSLAQCNMFIIVISRASL